jgi:hypothetical protein
MTHPAYQMIPQLDEHECDEAKEVDFDFCSRCEDHSTYCSICGLSACCGVKPLGVDGMVDDDPTPWCAACGAKAPKQCHCGPIAENE